MEALKNTTKTLLTYEQMLAYGLFVTGKSYYCQHYPSRERLVILGVSKDFKKVCVAAGLRQLQKELEYRQKEFGSGWL